jgi:hypothetical protein
MSANVLTILDSPKGCAVRPSGGCRAAGIAVLADVHHLEFLAKLSILVIGLQEIALG